MSKKINLIQRARQAHEHFVQELTEYVEQDKIFVLRAADSTDKNVHINAVKFTYNGFNITESLAFDLRVDFDKNGENGIYTIRYDLLPHKNIMATQKLYSVAKQKLDDEKHIKKYKYLLEKHAKYNLNHEVAPTDDALFTTFLGELALCSYKEQNQK